MNKRNFYTNHLCFSGKKIIIMFYLINHVENYLPVPPVAAATNWRYSSVA
jgi:hypothetical protein